MIMIKNVLLSAKIIGTVSLVGYVATILPTLDMIKLGTASEEVVSSLMNKFTHSDPILATRGNNIVNADNGVGEINYTGTALDSQLYNVLSGNDVFNKETVKADRSLSKFQINNPTSIANQFNKLENNFLFNNPISASAYKFQEQPLAQAAGIVMMVVGFITSGGQIADVWLVAGTAAGVVQGQIQNDLSNKLSTATNGMAVNSQTVGEDMGNAIGVGTSFYLSNSGANAGGLALSNQAAKQSLKKNNELIAQRAEEIEATHSPFDITTRHTIMGRIVFASLPYQARFVSMIGSLSSIVRMAKTSLFNLIPISEAARAAQKDEKINTRLSLCEDVILDDLKVTRADNQQEDLMARDLSCSPVIGFPVNYLESSYFDPELVLFRFAFKDETKLPGKEKRDLWNKANQGLSADELKDYAQKTYDPNGTLMDKTNENLRTYFRPKDKDGFCFFWNDQTPGQGYQKYIDQEISNICDQSDNHPKADKDTSGKSDATLADSHWHWVINDRDNSDSKTYYIQKSPISYETIHGFLFIDSEDFSLTESQWKARAELYSLQNARVLNLTQSERGEMSYQNSNYRLAESTTFFFDDSTDYTKADQSSTNKKTKPQKDKDGWIKVPNNNKNKTRKKPTKKPKTITKTVYTAHTKDGKELKYIDATLEPGDETLCQLSEYYKDEKTATNAGSPPDPSTVRTDTVEGQVACWNKYEDGKDIKYMAKANPLYKFRLNCFDRNRMPYGFQAEVKSGNENEEQSWQDMLTSNAAFNLKEVFPWMFGEDVYDNGQKCIVSGDGSAADRQKVDYGMFLTDSRLQCLLDNNLNCDF